VQAVDKNDLKLRFYDVITMMALLKFRTEKCDFVILETGIGGRLDATNFIK
jgi:dihydrofolate synthase / folylpolyglutamate synthase